MIIHDTDASHSISLCLHACTQLEEQSLSVLLKYIHDGCDAIRGRGRYTGAITAQKNGDI